MTYSTKKNQAPQSNIKSYGLGSNVVHPLTNSTHCRHLFALLLIPLYDDLFSDTYNALFEINLKLASHVLTDQQSSEFNTSNWFCTPPKM
jgi:hypothetical protein